MSIEDTAPSLDPQTPHSTTELFSTAKKTAFNIGAGFVFGAVTSWSSGSNALGLAAGTTVTGVLGHTSLYEAAKAVFKSFGSDVEDTPLSSPNQSDGPG